MWKGCDRTKAPQSVEFHKDIYIYILLLGVRIYLSGHGNLKKYIGDLFRVGQVRNA